MNMSVVKTVIQYSRNLAFDVGRSWKQIFKIFKICTDVAKDIIGGDKLAMNESEAIVIKSHLSLPRSTKHPTQPASQGVYKYQITYHISGSSTTTTRILQHLYPI